MPPTTTLGSLVPAAVALHSCLAAASLLTSASQINQQHKLTQWQVNWRLALVRRALVDLKLKNALYGTAPLGQHNARPGSSIGLSAYPSSLREATLTIIEESALSPGKIAILPTVMKVELAYELSLILDAPLIARFKIKH